MYPAGFPIRQSPTRPAQSDNSRTHFLLKLRAAFL